MVDSNIVGAHKNGFPPPAAASGAAGVAFGYAMMSPVGNVSTTYVTIVKEIQSEPTVNQKLFLVASVALATVCFFTNSVQVAVFARAETVRSVKSLLLLSQALAGLVAAFVVAFPIHVISARGESSVIGEEGYNACYLGHSAIILVCMLTLLSSSTLLLLHHYLGANHPRKYLTTSNAVTTWAIALSGVWIGSVVVGLLPWAGWNSWETHDARCHLSTLWPLSFTSFLTLVIGSQVALGLLMWASSRAAQLKAAAIAARNNASNSNEVEVAPISPARDASSNEGTVRVVGWLISLGSMVPLLVHVVVASSCAASIPCVSIPHHYHEDAAELPCSSLLLTAAAVANPLLYVFTDDQVSSATLILLSHLCCWVCGKKRPQMTPKQAEEGLDADSNVYVTNDTAQLVGDNT